MLRRKAERAVTARDAEQAIERAIKEYKIPECERYRVSVLKILCRPNPVQRMLSPGDQTP
jgi:hypothetical protein